ncbi:MAG: beta-lactamase family protein [Planctomycetes bacterium]|nr:beta-lactamase family protein [Planctomycetota bacterium]
MTGVSCTALLSPLLLVAAPLPLAGQDTSPASRSTVATASRPASPPGFSAADRALAELVARLRVPGGAIAVCQGGVLVHEHYVGRYGPDTRVPLASASKWLSGALVVAMVDAGRIELGAPIAKHLPEYAGAKASITVRHLFSHTSGLPLASAAQDDPRASLRDVARAVAAAPLVSPPGTEFRYGGLSMQVGAAVLEVAGGKPWRELFGERVAEPLGLKDTRYGRAAAVLEPRVAGGASSSVRDYLRFLGMLRNGGLLDGVRVLSPEAVEELLRPQTGAAAMRGVVGLRRAGSRYALGNWVTHTGQDGRGLWNTSPGAFGCIPWLDRRNDVYGILLIEDRRGARRRAGEVPDVIGAVYEALGLRRP